MGVSQQTFYTWRREFAGRGVAELRELLQFARSSHRYKSVK
jgi:hypothetical protein